MDKISNILVPFDFSVISKNALDYAVNFIAKDDIKIILVHVPKSGDEKSSQSLEESFEKLRESYSNKIKQQMRWIIGKGSLKEAIVEIQKNNNIELIIMGTSGSEDDTATTNASDVTMEVDASVLIIPESYEMEKVKNIALVLGNDEIDDSLVLGILLNAARRFDAKVHVLTIQNKPGTYGYTKTDEKNESILEYYLEKFYSHHTFIENEDILDGIFEYVENKNIDMLAILPKNHAKKSTPSEGRLTKLLVMRSKVPVLTID
ncbi:universal stress protein [Abyssalbus ytuae]|uniref:Universal stress protein n=1 Tax=Abyssalbus ytuae TaxID=2926907 RepID=A0A9E6ZVF3_9FLAO|nr:universal stress protein [Abyssalbus ytuae]UOB17521.1 universal stress protein [Abyssalbus ytuae]